MAQISDPSEQHPQALNPDEQRWPVSEPHDGSDPIVRPAPRIDEPQKHGFTAATWIVLIVGALVLVMLAIFILQNNVPADFTYLGWTFTLPLGVAMLLAAIAGMLVVGLFGSVRLFKLSRKVRRLEKERQSLKRTLR